jgi:hypothetical protein
MEGKGAVGTLAADLRPQGPVWVCQAAAAAGGNGAGKADKEKNAELREEKWKPKKIVNLETFQWLYRKSS